jgi:hypothetical protein
MPVLGAQKIKHIILPSSTAEDQAWVDISTRITADIALSMNGIDKGTVQDQKKATFELLSAIIVKWNFLTEDGAPAEITPENIAKLDINDVIEIQNNIELDKKVLDEAKKKASSSSLPPITPTPSV